MLPLSQRRSQIPLRRSRSLNDDTSLRAVAFETHLRCGPKDATATQSRRPQPAPSFRTPEKNLKKTLRCFTTLEMNELHEFRRSLPNRLGMLAPYRMAFVSSRQGKRRQLRGPAILETIWRLCNMGPGPIHPAPPGRQRNGTASHFGLSVRMASLPFLPTATALMRRQSGAIRFMVQRERRKPPGRDQLMQNKEKAPQSPDWHGHIWTSGVETRTAFPEGRELKAPCLQILANVSDAPHHNTSFF